MRIIIKLLLQTINYICKYYDIMMDLSETGIMIYIYALIYNK